jgi:hypothetical protein
MFNAVRSLFSCESRPSSPYSKTCCGRTITLQYGNRNFPNLSFSAEQLDLIMAGLYATTVVLGSDKSHINCHIIQDWDQKYLGYYYPGRDFFTLSEFLITTEMAAFQKDYPQLSKSIRKGFPSQAAVHEILHLVDWEKKHPSAVRYYEGENLPDFETEHEIRARKMEINWLQCIAPELLAVTIKSGDIAFNYDIRLQQDLSWAMKEWNDKSEIPI